MARRWTPGKTRVQLQIGWDVTVVAMSGSVDANQGQEFRIRDGAIGRYDLNQLGRRPGHRIVVFDRDDGRQIRTQMRSRSLKGCQPHM